MIWNAFPCDRRSNQKPALFSPSQRDQCKSGQQSSRIRRRRRRIPFSFVPFSPLFTSKSLQAMFLFSPVLIRFSLSIHAICFCVDLSLLESILLLNNVLQVSKQVILVKCMRIPNFLRQKGCKKKCVLEYFMMNMNVIWQA